MRRDRNLEKLESLVENCTTYAHQTGLFKCGGVDIGSPARMFPPERYDVDRWHVKITSEGGDEVTFQVHDGELDKLTAEQMTIAILERFVAANKVLCRKRDESLSICVGAGT